MKALLVSPDVWERFLDVLNPPPRKEGGFIAMSTRKGTKIFLFSGLPFGSMWEADLGEQLRIDEDIGLEAALKIL